MLVFWKENLVLLSVPKTGTTALQGALAPHAAMVLRNPPHLKHSPAYRYKRFLKPFFKQAGGQDPEVMAVVRNPIDWLGSWYRYRSREDLIGHPNSTYNVSFDTFVDEYCKGNPAQFAAVGSQSKFMYVNGTLGVDHLFRYEAQDKIIAFLEQRLQRTIKLKQLNVSPKKDFVLSPEIEAKLREKRPEEFAIWELGQS
ncbi:hypothetical protein [Loktanella sp. S4079]|uniref:hypothetical protein n=1 Tax=Loktanella sp. S4079 TaxID=579483 RepID=UPI0005FA787F|nr:hypothetical protein [Loktanella sp. S4079]KJZ20032.1 gamma-glutamyl kinase [Loktanella sp. S4079]